MADISVTLGNKREKGVGKPAGTIVDILGVPIHDITMEELLRDVESLAASGSPHQIVTVNPEFVMISRERKDFRTVLEEATISIPDGMGIIWASRILRRPLRERVTGVEAVQRMAALAANRGLRVFLLGAAPGVAEIVAMKLKDAFPGLEVAGTHAGSPDPREDDEICRKIEAVRPHLLFVAYGPPRQDLWIYRNQPRLRVPVAMGVGGTFDFIAGIALRAPLWMQNGGLEWLHRLIKQPSRWRRMLTLPRFAGRVVLETIPGFLKVHS